MAKIGVGILLFLCVVFLGVQIRGLWVRRADLRNEYTGAQDSFAEAKDKRNELAGEVKDLQNPENMEKELRARFDYRAPGETTLILVPEDSE